MRVAWKLVWSAVASAVRATISGSSWALRETCVRVVRASGCCKRMKRSLSDRSIDWSVGRSLVRSSFRWDFACSLARSFVVRVRTTNAKRVTPNCTYSRLGAQVRRNGNRTRCATLWERASARQGTDAHGRERASANALRAPTSGLVFMNEPKG